MHQPLLKHVYSSARPNMCGSGRYDNVDDWIPVSDLPYGKNPLVALTPDKIFLCVATTPFGLPDVPEVKITVETASMLFCCPASSCSRCSWAALTRSAVGWPNEKQSFMETVPFSPFSSSSSTFSKSTFCV